MPGIKDLTDGTGFQGGHPEGHTGQKSSDSMAGSPDHLQVQTVRTAWASTGMAK